MDLNRRMLLGRAGVMVLAAGLPMPSLAADELITKAIPSSAEPLPVIGVGTARRFQGASGEAELAPLRESLRKFLELGGSVIDTAPSYGNAEAVVGSLLVATAAKSEGTGRLLLGMTVLYGLPIVGVALSRTLWITLPLLFLAGVLGAAFMSGNNALVQHRVTDDVRGRVMGAYMLTWGLMPLGSLPMGMVADRIGTPVAVASGAVISSVLAGILALTSSTVRDV